MFETRGFGYFSGMTSKQDKRAGRDSAKTKTGADSSTTDHVEAVVEDAVEELAATFGVGPKAAPKPVGPLEGEQLAP